MFKPLVVLYSLVRFAKSSNCSYVSNDYYFDYIANDGSYDGDSDNVCIICYCHDININVTEEICDEYSATTIGIGYVQQYCNISVWWY